MASPADLLTEPTFVYPDVTESGALQDHGKKSIRLSGKTKLVGSEPNTTVSFKTLRIGDPEYRMPLEKRGFKPSRE